MDYNLTAKPNLTSANLTPHDIEVIFDALGMAESEMGHAEDALDILKTEERLATIVKDWDHLADVQRRIARWQRK